jgi:glycosyltransferase involved in cell wall biosynthesis
MNSSKSSKSIAPKKHLVFINYYYPPMGGGGVQRLTKFLKYFDYQKYVISVLTVKPSFFYTLDESMLKEIPSEVRVFRSGSLDPFRLLYFFQVINSKLKRIFVKGIKTKEGHVENSSSTHPESANLIRRISMFFFVPDSRILWLPFALIKLWRLNRLKPINMIVASMPPFTTGLIGILFQQWIKIPTILDFRDAWTCNPYLPKLGSIYSTLNEKMEKFCVEKAQGLIFVNPKLQEYYEKKYPDISAKPLTNIRNGFDSTDFKLISKTAKSPKQSFTIGIMGTIYSQGNRPITLLRAVEELIKEEPHFESEICLKFLGKWSSDFLKLLNQFQIKRNVELIPYLPHQRALMKAAEFDVLSLSIESNLPGKEFVTPGRIYEYMRLGKPILALCSLDSDLVSLIRDHNAGLAIEYDQTAEIKSQLKKWISNNSTLRELYSFDNLQKLERRKLTDSLIKFLENFN